MTTTNNPQPCRNVPPGKGVLMRASNEKAPGAGAPDSRSSAHREGRAPAVAREGRAPARLIPEAVKAFLATLLLFTPMVSIALTPIADGQLSSITGQALLVSDYIAPNSISGDPNSNIGFYRLGIDATVDLNMNIDKLQLGCGGVNEAIKTGCDIDLDYVSFMGLNANKTGPGAAVTSDFEMVRPYFEIAVKNPESASGREMVGFKVGAQSATGYFGVGCKKGDTGCSTSKDLGVNSLSGYMNIYLNGTVKFNTTVGGGSACIGRPPSNSHCTGNPDGVFYNNSNMADQYRTAFAGTRLTEISMSGVHLWGVYDAGGVIKFLNPDDMYTIISARLNEVHGFILNNTQDFFVSFERESVAYPKYDKTGYAYTANAGWWMNVPRVELAELTPATVELGCPSLCTGLLASFSRPGINAGYPDLKSLPPKNCYGSYKFC